MNNLTVQTELLDGSALVRLEGDLDIAASHVAETSLARLGSDIPPARVILDLRGLTFMDSTGLRIILSADSEQRSHGRDLILVRGKEVVQRVFRLARLEDRLTFVDDPAEVQP